MYSERVRKAESQGIRTGEEALLSSALETIHVLNERCLGLLRDLASSQSEGLPPFLASLAPLLKGLDFKTIGTAAQQPFLLVDFAFGNPTLFRELLSRESIQLRFQQLPSALPIADATALARGALLLAQSVCRHHPAHAGLLLGLDFSLRLQVAQLRLPDLEYLAEAFPHHLQLRWDRPEVWQYLLTAAASLQPSAMDEFRMYGIQLTASESSSLRAHRVR